jgi:ribosomal protein L15
MIYRLALISRLAALDVVFPLDRVKLPVAVPRVKAHVPARVDGGQNPLMQRLPKLPGFRSIRPKMENVFTGQLDQFGNGTVDNFTLFEAGLTSSPHVRVKLVSKGEVTKKVTVKLQAASENAVAAVQKAGGSFSVMPQVGRTAKEKTEK